MVLLSIFNYIIGKCENALLAQLVERKAVNLKVIGSNPIQSDYKI